MHRRLQLGVWRRAAVASRVLPQAIVVLLCWRDVSLHASVDADLIRVLPLSIRRHDDIVGRALVVAALIHLLLLHEAQLVLYELAPVGLQRVSPDQVQLLLLLLWRQAQLLELRPVRRAHRWALGAGQHRRRGRGVVAGLAQEKSLICLVARCLVIAVVIVGLTVRHADILYLDVL